MDILWAWAGASARAIRDRRAARASGLCRGASSILQTMSGKAEGLAAVLRASLKEKDVVDRAEQRLAWVARHPHARHVLSTGARHCYLPPTPHPSTFELTACPRGRYIWVMVRCHRLLQQYQAFPTNEYESTWLHRVPQRRVCGVLPGRNDPDTAPIRGRRAWGRPCLYSGTDVVLPRRNPLLPGCSRLTAPYWPARAQCRPLWAPLVHLIAIFAFSAS